MQKSIRHKSKRGAIIMLLTVMTPFLLVPLAGLAIDATVIHIVQTKLQGAVDAAALGAGRLLGTPANITEIAGEFFNANFTVGTRGFWGATLPSDPNGNPAITYTNGIAKKVTVNARVEVPTLFMRIFGYTHATVSAVGEASRRDARVIFVLDRSGSMTGDPIMLVKTWTQSFIKEFTPNVDEVGLVVFDSTAVVGYPSTNSYSTTVSASGGPDASFWDGTTGGKSTYQQDAVYQTGQLNVGGGTNMAEALSLAYIELQKAHLRALQSGPDLKTNAILLFTDGVPSAVSVYANDPNHSGPWITTGSGCTYRTDDGNHPIKFWLALAGPTSGSPPYTNVNTVNHALASMNVNSGAYNTPLWFMQHGAYDSNNNPTQNDPEWGTPANEGPGTCLSLSASPGRGTLTSQSDASFNSLTQIPLTDAYGNSTSGGDSYPPHTTAEGYKDSYWIDGNSHVPSPIYRTGTGLGDFTYSTAVKGRPYQWGLAMWNATDNAATNIRNDANHTARGETNPMPIQILVIGYSGDGGTDAGLLKRIANDPNDSQAAITLPTSFSTQPQGKFCLGTDLTTLQQCVNVMSSILLHLTK